MLLVINYLGSPLSSFLKILHNILLNFFFNFNGEELINMS